MICLQQSGIDRTVHQCHIFRKQSQENVFGHETCTFHIRLTCTVHE